MELTPSFRVLLQHFIPVFTAPTFHTFVQIVTGWVLSQRHRYITEVIFSGGNVGNGHWSRFHRFFSHAAWDLDTLSCLLAKLIVTILAPGATILWAVDDTLCRKRGLTLYGAGMHHDPLISSRAKSLVSWGHDWVVLCLLVVNPFWAPTKVFALPVAVRLYRNRQGLTKGKRNGQEEGAPAQARPEPSHPAGTGPRTHRSWWPAGSLTMRSCVTGDSAYGGKSVLSKLPPTVHLISHVHPKGALYEPAPSKTRRPRGQPARRANACRP